MSFLFLSILLHAYVALRVGPDLPGQWPLLFGASMLVSAWLMPHAFRSRGRVASRWGTALTWASYIVMGLFSSLFVLTLLRDAGLAAAWLVDALRPGTLSMATWRLRSAEWLPIVAALVTWCGFVNARRTAAVVSVDVPIEGLPAVLHGFTIAQISDVHVGPTIRRDYLEAIVERVNGIDADIVAITGDLVDGSVRDLAEHVAPLARLTSRHGTFFVTGNHEYYSGAASWVAELRRLGVQVLMNEHVVLQRAGESIVIGGVTDFGAHRFDPLQASDPKAALAGASSTAALRVLLAHQPRSAAAAEQAGFDVQLSGHTHGGQFLPWNFFVRFQQPFTAGLHRWKRLWVYTSRGTGYWGPPKRFGAPSEITRLRLTAAASGGAGVIRRPVVGPA